MKRTSQRARAAQALFLGLVFAMAVVGPAAAYVGPGAGLTAIGAILAVIATLFFAVVGFVWYPVKRLLRKRRPTWESENRERAASAAADD
jgi:hypothetical protein